MQSIFSATAARLEAWKAQPGVLGVLLVGSKSRGHNDELSDDDLEVLLSDEAFAQLAPADCGEIYIEGEGADRRLIYDVQYTSFANLERKPASHDDLDHWPYERAQVLFDRDGRVSAAVAAAGRMDPEFRHARLLHATIDAWVAPRRAMKTLKRDADCAGRMLIARGAKALSRVIFALEHRWVPLEHWLEAELRTLEDPQQVGPLLCQAVNTADPGPLEEALSRLEDRLFAEGVPRASNRRALFYELLHASRVEERSIHGLH